MGLLRGGVNFGRSLEWRLVERHCSVDGSPSGIPCHPPPVQPFPHFRFAFAGSMADSRESRSDHTLLPCSLPSLHASLLSPPPLPRLQHRPLLISTVGCWKNSKKWGSPVSHYMPLPAFRCCQINDRVIFEKTSFLYTLCFSYFNYLQSWFLSDRE